MFEMFIKVKFISHEKTNYNTVLKCHQSSNVYITLNVVK